MFEFGKSYVISLADSIIDPTGNEFFAIFGDFKGQHEFGDDLFVQIGDMFIKSDLIRCVTQSDKSNLKSIQVFSIFEDSAFTFERPSHITNAHITFETPK